MPASESSPDPTPSRGRLDARKFEGRITRSVKHNLTKPMGVARWFAERCDEVSMEAGRPRVKDVPNLTRVAAQLKTDFGSIPLADIVAAMEVFLADDSWLDNPYPAWSQFYRRRVALMEAAKSVRLSESSEWDAVSEDLERRRRRT